MTRMYCKVDRKVQLTQNLPSITNTTPNATMNTQFRTSPAASLGNRSAFTFKYLNPLANTPSSTNITTTTKPVNSLGGSSRAGVGVTKMIFCSL